MEIKELNKQAGKILGVKGEVEFARIYLNPENCLNVRVTLGIIPSKYQARKLRNLLYEYAKVQPIKGVNNV